MKDNLATIIETQTRVENLEDRFDRHLISIESKLDKFENKMDLMNENITKLKIEGESVSMKFKGLFLILGFAGAAIWEVIKGFAGRFFGHTN